MQREQKEQRKNKEQILRYSQDDKNQLRLYFSLFSLLFRHVDSYGFRKYTYIMREGGEYSGTNSGWQESMSLEKYPEAIAAW